MKFLDNSKKWAQGYVDSHPVLYSLAKHNLALNAATMFGKFVTLLLLVPIARQLGPEVYGSYSSVLGFIGMFYAFNATGYDEVVVLECSRDPSLARKYFGKLLTLRVYVAIIAFIVSTACLALFPTSIFNFPPSMEANLVLIALAYSLSILYYLPASVFMRAFQFLDKNDHIAYSQFLERVVFGLGVIVFFYLGIVGGVKSLFLSLLLSTFACSVYWAYFGLKLLPMDISPKLDIAFLKSLFPKAKWFGAAGIFVLLSGQVNIYLSQLLSSPEQSSFFFVSYGLVSILLYAASNIYWTTMVISAKKASKKFFRSFASRAFLFVFVVLAGSIAGYFLSGFVMKLIYGAKYLPAVPSLSVLIFLVPLSMASLWGDQVLTSTDNQHKRVLAMGLAFIVNIALCFFLIPSMGALGSSYALLSSQAVLTGATLAQGYLVYRKLPASQN